MAGIFSYKCTTCSALHEGSPSFLVSEPWQYHVLSEKQRTGIASLSEDICTIKDSDHTDYFILVNLEIPIIGVEQPFIWSIWISLSEKSFNHYNETRENPVEAKEYFGWLCNKLPTYPDTLNLKALAHPRLNGQLPTIKLEPTDHPLSVDFYKGITIARAQEIAEQLVHRFSSMQN